VTQIGPQIHRIESVFDGRWLASYLLAGRRPLLVDSGFAVTPETVIWPYLGQIGVPVDRLRWLVVTHASGDHFGGNGAIKQSAPRITVIAHAADAASIAQHTTFVAEHIDFLRAEGYPVPAISVADPGFRALHGAETSVDWVVQGGESLDLGEGWEVTLVHAPGHTPGHLVVWDPRHRVLFAGDALMGDGIPDVDGHLVMPPHYFDVEAYRRTLQTVRALSPQLILATHYLPIMGDGVERFLEASTAFVARCEEIVADLLAQPQPQPIIAATLVALRRALGIPGADYQYSLLARAHLRNQGVTMPPPPGWPAALSR